MSAAPVFATTPRCGYASVSAANTNRDGTGTIVDALTTGAAGSRIERVVLKASVDPADSIVTMFIHDGTAYRLFDEFDLENPAAGSTTVPAIRLEKAYADLILPTGFKVAFAITVALTSGVINAFVLGSDF